MQIAQKVSKAGEKGQGRGKGGSGERQVAKKISLRLPEAASIEASKDVKAPNYMSKLAFVSVLDARDLSLLKVESNLDPHQNVKGLKFKERQIQVHKLANEYLRVFAAAGEKGRRLALHKAVTKEKALHDYSVKNGLIVDIHRGKLAAQMKKVQEMMSRSEALECSDEEMEVDDNETIARRNMLNGLKRASENDSCVDSSKSDWTCKKCYARVFAHRRECFKCQAPRVPLFAKKHSFLPAAVGGAAPTGGTDEQDKSALLPKAKVAAEEEVKAEEDGKMQSSVAEEQGDEVGAEEEVLVEEEEWGKGGEDGGEGHGKTGGFGKAAGSAVLARGTIVSMLYDDGCWYIVFESVWSKESVICVTIGQSN
jgi:hypothetical protein